MNNLKMMFEKIGSWLVIPSLHVMDIVEIVIIAVLFYYIICWIKDTRAWVIIKGLVVLFAAWLLALLLNFDVILWLFSNTIGVGITTMIILFQPELRKVLEQLGTKKIVNLGMFSESSVNNDFSDDTVNELVRGTFELARSKTGALIVIEQTVKLTDYASTGIEIDGIVTSQLLRNIFEHNTPLHDGAVVLRGNRIVSATCYLPLSENMRLSKDLGTRHRAGVGISETTDSFTIIVSEETGKVSIARGGSLIYNVDGDFLRAKLTELKKEKAEKKPFFKKGRKKK